jgi:hypothetical protein
MEAGIEANVFKMDQMDEVLVSKIHEEYHWYGPSKSVTTTLRTNGPAFFLHRIIWTATVRFHQQEVQYSTPPGLIV